MKELTDKELERYRELYSSAVDRYMEDVSILDLIEELLPEKECKEFLELDKRANTF